MNLASNTAPVASTPHQGVAAIHPRLACLTRCWRDDLSRVGPLIPAPIKRLSGHAKLNNEVSREVPRFDLTPFFPPQPHQGVFIALPMIIRASSDARRVHRLRSSTAPLTTKGTILLAVCLLLLLGRLKYFIEVVDRGSRYAPPAVFGRFSFRFLGD
jgi:hypothetical protein